MQNRVNKCEIKFESFILMFVTEYKPIYKEIGCMHVRGDTSVIEKANFFIMSLAYPSI